MPILAAVWPYRRAILWGCIVAAVALMGWRVSAWREAYKALPGVQAALAAEEACEDGSKCAARQAALQAAAEAQSKEVVAGYEQELAELRNRPAVRRVIRVCPGAGDVQSAGPAGTADGAGPAAGVVSGPVEFDTAPLRSLARDADEVAARLRALQEWNAALAR